MNVNLDGTKIGITKIMASEPRRISEIKAVINFPGGLPVDEKQRTILEKAALTCPVFHSLHPDINQDISFNWD
jgi:uncharacterized OsmC-like protein